MLFFLILLMNPLAGIGVDLYSPSLPAIAHHFNAHENLVKLTIAIYILGYGIGQPFFGTLSDSFGRRKILLTGTVFYIITSLLSAFSFSIHILLLMRFLQGIAVAAIGVIPKSIVTDHYTGKHIAKMATYLTTTWALGPIIAPAIGGYLQVYIGWQASFYLLTLYGVCVFLLALIFLPETNKHLTPLQIPIIIKNYRAVISHQAFISAVLCMAIIYSFIAIFNVAAPFLIQNVLHFSPITYGHIAFVMGFAFFLGSLINRFIIHMRPIDQILLFSTSGSVLISCGMLLITLFMPLSIATIVIPSFLLFFTGGFIFPNCMGKCLSLFSKMAGTASAVMGSLFVIGTAIMTIIASVLKSTTQLPLAIIYLTLSIICLLSCLILLKTSKNKLPSATPKPTK